MNRFTPGRLTAGDAARLNEMYEELSRLRRLTAAPPLSIVRNAGIPSLRLDAADPVLLGEVVSSAGAPPVHTVKRKTRDAANAVVDFVPTVTYDQVLNPAGTAHAAGTLVELVPVPDHYGWFWAVAFPATAPGTGFFARLTTSSGGKWKYYKLTLDNTGAWIDDGAESGAFNAVPSTVNGTLTSTPTGGLRVWMWQSKQAGFYEFLPLNTGDRDRSGIVPTGAAEIPYGKKTLHGSASGASKPAIVLDPDEANSWACVSIYSDDAVVGGTDGGATGIRVFAEDNGGSPRVRVALYGGYYNSDLIIMEYDGSFENVVRIRNLDVTGYSTGILPPPPVPDGAYVLTCTVTGGIPVISWV